MTGVLTTRGNLDTDMHRRNTMRRDIRCRHLQANKGGLEQFLPSQASKKNLTNTMNLDF